MKKQLTKKQRMALIESLRCFWDNADTSFPSHILFMQWCEWKHQHVEDEWALDLINWMRARKKCSDDVMEAVYKCEGVRKINASQEELECLKSIQEKTRRFLKEENSKRND